MPPPLRLAWLSLTCTFLGLSPALGQAAPAPEAPPARDAADAEPARDPTTAPDGEHHTALAGEELHLEMFGRQITVPARDRRGDLAVTIGAAGFTPNIGGQTAVPLFALYWIHLADTWRVRAVVSGLVNEVDASRELWDGVQLLAHFENYTIPFASTEIVDGQELKETSLVYGSADLWLGGGYRWSIWPGNVDNTLQVGAYYRAGWVYHQRTDDTADTSRTPTDTYVHGLAVRVTLDAFQRNLLELPHYGVAFGSQLELTRRDHWRAYGPQGPTASRVFDHRETRDYWKVSGYVVVATPVPFLSERHRLVGYAHAGYGPSDDLDRTSAFRLGGGPIPTEAGDLRRNPLPGAVFDQYPVSDFFVGTVEYRLEAMFFLYLHVRATYALLNTSTVRGADGLELDRQDTYIVSTAVTAGFLWDSLLYVQYDFDLKGTFRGGADGHAILFTWSKAF